MDELPPTGTSGTSSSSAFSDRGLAESLTQAMPSNLNSWRDGPLQPGAKFIPAKTASPQLGDALFARLVAFGTPQETHPGDVLFKPGDVDVDLIVVDRGSVDVIRTETVDVPAKTVAKVRAGGFVGELNLLTGQNVYLLCRVREAGTVYRITPERLRQLMADDGELSDIIFRALVARRELLQRSAGARAVEIVGNPRSAAGLALRTYAARQRLIHVWFDAGSPAGETLMESSGLTEDDLPAVVHARHDAETGDPGHAGPAAEPQLPPLLQEAGRRDHRRRRPGRARRRRLRRVGRPGHARC